MSLHGFGQVFHLEKYSSINMVPFIFLALVPIEASLIELSFFCTHLLEAITST